MRLVIFLWCFIALVSAAPQYHVLPSLRDRAAIQNSWQKERIEKVIPRILEKYNVDMWIIAQREYGEDTVFWSLKMAETFAARRRTIYIFERTNGTYRHHIFLDNTAQIWKDVRSVVEKADPRSIVLNIDQDIAFSDGLHAGEREILERTLGPWRARIRREPNVAVEVIETRVDGMLEVYRQMMENVHAMISEAFSARTITPGQTTTMDLVWWYRERIQAQNMTTWFHPSVEVFRKGGHDKVPNEPEDEDVVILPGDVLHVDVGVVAYGLATDTQHMGYVLAEGETEPPATIKNALRTHSNKMQDAVRRALKVGSTGDDVLKESLEDIERQGVVGTVYSHPIGDW
ncbi:hypothetical protein BZG36_01062 [Bifiguratus adelaidae]|uniref:Peptidase M24 domain-containing protein n=1 Tax=Bifiguratus adelaidae TaxID=1938954 RepID=A0A261Y6E6_9FUNG|nr:hypothetical protein BZG36_01062 [Bifiguratus adelaidae]